MSVSDLKTEVPCPEIKYLHRRLPDADLYFIFNESNEEVSFDATFSGSGNASSWDAFTGEILPIKNITAKKDRTNIPVKLEGWETKFILISGK